MENGELCEQTTETNGPFLYCFVFALCVCVLALNIMNHKTARRNKQMEKYG